MGAGTLAPGTLRGPPPMFRSSFRQLLAGLLLGIVGTVLAAEPDAARVTENTKEIAGTAEFLRLVPKRFATFQSCDPAEQHVTLLVEGEKEAKTWPVVPDAEIKVDGWWGRLTQLTRGDRVWVWFKSDRPTPP